MTSKSSIPLRGVFILACEMQHTCKCYDKPSRKLKRNYHYRIEHLNETSYKV